MSSSPRRDLRAPSASRNSPLLSRVAVGGGGTDHLHAPLLDTTSSPFDEVEYEQKSGVGVTIGADVQGQEDDMGAETDRRSARAQRRQATRGPSVICEIVALTGRA